MAPIPSPRESGFTHTTAVPLYWARYGRVGAPVLLVLHGGPGAHHDYLLPQFLDLADDYELVFYDQRGGGQSKTDDREPITWQTHVLDLVQVVGELGIDPLSLVGYSWGGLLALLFAIEAAAHRTTHHPSRLVLIDPAPVTANSVASSRRNSCDARRIPPLRSFAPSLRTPGYVSVIRMHIANERSS